MLGSRRWALSAALGLASTCLLAPAAAYAPAEEDPIELAPEVADATEVEPGTHQLKLPEAGAEGSMQVQRTMSGSTMWFGQTYVSEAMENEWVTMMVPNGGENCPTGEFAGSDYHRHRFMTGVVGIGPRCEDGDTVVLTEDATTSSPVGGEVVDLAIWEEPPVENREVLPPPSLEQKWVNDKELPAEGTAELGETYAEAPDLTGGRWDVHVDPGQPALFRADLNWNEHLQVHFTYEGKKAGEAIIYPILITPIGGESQWGQAVDAPGTGTVMTSYPGSEGTVVSPSLTWRNREANGVTAAFPGTYYVMLRLGTKDAPKQGADLSLSVKVVSDGEPQSPYASEHANTEAALPPDIGGHREDEEEKDTEAASDSGSDSTPWIAVGGLLGGSVVMSVAGGASLARYRRSLG